MKALWIIAMLVVLSLTGCGIAQDKYDAVVKERDSAKTEATSLRGDLTNAKTQVTSVQGDLEKTKVQVKSLQDELSGTKAKYSDLEAQNASAAKQIDALKQETTKLKRLTILKTTFCSAKPDPNNIPSQPDNSYKVGQSVWFYAEIIGHKYVPVSPKLKMDFEAVFTILNDKGEVANKWSASAEREFDRPSPIIWYFREYPNLKAGAYTLDLIITDKLSGETANWKGDFRVTT